MNLFASMNFLLAAAPGLLASNVSAIGQVLGRNHQEASGSVVADTPEHATKGYQVSTLDQLMVCLVCLISHIFLIYTIICAPYHI